MKDHGHAVATTATARPGDALSVPPERLLQDWKEAHRRARAYLDALGWPVDGRDALAKEAVSRALAARWDDGADAIGETLRAVRELVTAGEPPVEGDPFLAWRAALAVQNDARALGAKRLCAMPDLARGRMVPEQIDRRLVGRLGRGRVPADGGPHPLYGRRLRRLRSRLEWPRVAHRRRFLLVLLVLLPTTVASGFMVNVLPYGASTWLEFAIVCFFGALFGWISIGFWTALMGFVLLLRGRDRWGITQLAPETPAESIPPAALTAVCMPIANEPVDRVFAGLRAIERSVARTGRLDRFHFFVLSDSSDPDVLVREEEAWVRWCREVQGFGRIFYRRRKVRLARKSGNVADFCRRFGRRYRYMIMLDADSVMRGDTLVRLVELMERHPDAGMVQTVPTAVNRRSLFARAQQFATHVYGPMFAAGLHFWQLGDGQYWGHNTIIRVQPFMEHCALPTLPGREPLGGEILSHDFVEAALMGRSGWTLWLAYDLPGSWEEVPSTLLEEMRRDRRWCQGNLQHLRLVFTDGLFGAHRALFLNGALAYMSALLWFAFLTLSTVEALQVALSEPNYFPNGPSLFPEWPVWRPDWAYALLAVIAMLLFLPKGLAILLIWLRHRESRLYGGVVRLTTSVVLEILLSSLLAPIRMVFHSRFVLTNLLGRTVAWKSQVRDDEATTWREAVRQHGLDSLVASLWGTGLFLLSPSYFWWVTPIIGALILAVPTSVFTSRVSAGDRARRLGLFLIPEETDPPLELREMEAFQEAARWHTARLSPAERDGFVRAGVDPLVNAVRRLLAGAPRRTRARIAVARRGLVERALAEGPGSLNARERRILLNDPASVDALHRGIWALADRGRAARWGRPGTAAPSA